MVTSVQFFIMERPLMFEMLHQHNLLISYQDYFFYFDILCVVYSLLKSNFMWLNSSNYVWYSIRYISGFHTSKSWGQILILSICNHYYFLVLILVQFGSILVYRKFHVFSAEICSGQYMQLYFPSKEVIKINSKTF